MDVLMCHDSAPHQAQTLGRSGQPMAAGPEFGPGQKRGCVPRWIHTSHPSLKHEDAGRDMVWRVRLNVAFAPRQCFGHLQQGWTKQWFCFERKNLGFKAH
jgi:hypothetical protein